MSKLIVRRHAATQAQWRTLQPLAFVCKTAAASPIPSARTGVIIASGTIHAAADQAANARRPPNARAVMQRGVAHTIVRTRWEPPPDYQSAEVMNKQQALVVRRRPHVNVQRVGQVVDALLES